MICDTPYGCVISFRFSFVYSPPQVVYSSGVGLEHWFGVFFSFTISLYHYHNGYQAGPVGRRFPCCYSHCTTLLFFCTYSPLTLESHVINILFFRPEFKCYSPNSTLFVLHTILHSYVRHSPFSYHVPGAVWALPLRR